MPDALTGLRLETHDAFGEQIVTGPMASVEVVGRGLGGEIDVTKLFVRRHRCPHARMSRVAPRLPLPRLVAEFTKPRNRVEDPEPLARMHVVAPRVTGHELLVRAPSEVGADDGDVTHDQRR